VSYFHGRPMTPRGTEARLLVSVHRRLCIVRTGGFSSACPTRSAVDDCVDLPPGCESFSGTVSFERARIALAPRPRLHTAPKFSVHH
jgi:hypothetical protein